MGTVPVTPPRVPSVVQANTPAPRAVHILILYALLYDLVLRGCIQSTVRRVGIVTLGRTKEPLPIASAPLVPLVVRRVPLGLWRVLHVMRGFILTVELPHVVRAGLELSLSLRAHPCVLPVDVDITVKREVRVRLVPLESTPVARAARAVSIAVLEPMLPFWGCLCAWRVPLACMSSTIMSSIA